MVRLHPVSCHSNIFEIEIVKSIQFIHSFVRSPSLMYAVLPFLMNTSKDNWLVCRQSFFFVILSSQHSRKHVADYETLGDNTSHSADYSKMISTGGSGAEISLLSLSRCTLMRSNIISATPFATAGNTQIPLQLLHPKEVSFFVILTIITFIHYLGKILDSQLR